jgi:CRP-like cAMP-binding protein
VIVLVRGRAQILMMDANGQVLFRSNIGDGEVVGDVGVIASRPRSASIKSLNRLSYLMIPDTLFLEAMGALGVLYDGYFKALFQRRLLFQSAYAISQDVSTLVLNRIAKHSRTLTTPRGTRLYSKGRPDGRLLICPRDVELSVGRRKERVTGPSVIGECEFFLDGAERPVPRLHSAMALEDMELLELDMDAVRNVPVIVDNLRHVIQQRRRTLYKGLPQIDPTAV